MEYFGNPRSSAESYTPEHTGEYFRGDEPESGSRHNRLESADSVPVGCETDLSKIRDQVLKLYSADTTHHGSDLHTTETAELDAVAQIDTVSLSLRNKLRQRAGEMLGINEYHTRPTTEEDIDALVSIDMQAFRAVYKDYGMSDEELRADLTYKFSHRFKKIGGEWMPILEKQGKPVGFMVCCPTNNKPEDFESWEKTTDNGSLESTYVADGKYVYVVSLSMLPEGSRQQGQNMLFADQIAKFISEGREKAFFESRMPGLRRWVEARCAENSENIDQLSEDRKLELAETYFSLTKTVKGKEVPYDHLLHIYSAAGCDLKKVFANAYVDEPSMNFGVMCEFVNPIPASLRNPLVNKIASGCIKVASRSHKLMQKFF